MNITSAIFEAYLQCPTKCYLRAKGEIRSGNSYTDWVRAEDEAYRSRETERLMGEMSAGECIREPIGALELKTTKFRLLLDVMAQVDNLEARIHAVEVVPSEGRGKASQIIPVCFVFRNKLTKEDKLLLAFEAMALSKVLNRAVNQGKIIHGDGHVTLRVKTACLYNRVGKLTEKIEALLNADKASDLVLNRHCGECEYRDLCRQKAIEKDDLSLLSGMSEKERKKLNTKGIFTVTQLSYTFRPRRRPKKLRDKREKYHHSLKALAIREKKIHIVGSPELKIEGTPVYFDVEGLPDRDFYYLIGLLVGDGSSAVQHSLWANSEREEKNIWEQFIRILDSIENPVLIHYGSYDVQFLKHACTRYGYAASKISSIKAIEAPVNILSHIYGKIYFPTFSNGLKEVVEYLGCPHPSSMKYGVETLGWRSVWEKTGNAERKNILIEYNHKDCEALQIITSKIAAIKEPPKNTEGVTYADAIGKTTSNEGAEIHNTFKLLLQSAHADYKKYRIKIFGNRPNKLSSSGKSSKICYKTMSSPRRGRRRTVFVKRKLKCPRHPKEHLRQTNKSSSHTILDLVFNRNGINKTWFTYTGYVSRCPVCKCDYCPPRIAKLSRLAYGRGIISWIIYHRIVLRLSYRLISKAVLDLLGERMSIQTISYIVERVAGEYAPTSKRLLQVIQDSPVIHADETQLNVQGINNYVWVITDGRHVVFCLTETRETAFLQELLKGYNGTLVTDFYGGYDALTCNQQKCLVHLIRDLNDDLWKNPFDKDYELFLAAIRDLLIPMFEDVWKYGLKVFHLRKHKEKVEKFYKDIIASGGSCSEVIEKYKKRFVRYRQSMFRFLEGDGIPWNNNAAERAIRHLAIQRKISGSFSSAGAHNYLGLLAIAQTCRFQDKSFIGFLLSGCRDVDQYHERNRGNKYTGPTINNS